MRCMHGRFRFFVIRWAQPRHRNSKELDVGSKTRCRIINGDISSRVIVRFVFSEWEFELIELDTRKLEALVAGYCFVR